jgi:hypothetical protein
MRLDSHDRREPDQDYEYKIKISDLEQAQTKMQN